MDARELVDAGLEVTIVGSFSRAGFLARRRLFGWSTPAGETLEGRTVLITGPTSGLGRAAAGGLAALGARVILVGRSQERLEAVRDWLVAAHGEDRFPIVVADTGSLPSVRAAVAQILDAETRLDVLVDNAGAIFPDRIVGTDGIEMTLATLVVGPFTLIGGLLPLLRKDGGARVIAVTSGGMYAQRLDPADLQPTAGYRGREPTLAASAPRSRSSASGRAGWLRRVFGSMPCIRAGRPRRASRNCFPGSTD